MTLLVVVPATITPAAQPRDFRHMAVITGALTPGVPVRLPLAQPIIAATTNGFADLRLFDDHGQETPYIIYAQNAGPAAPPAFNFRVLSYSHSDAGETIVLERPESARAFREMTIATAARNFHKSVRTETSHDLVTWQGLITDTIFDFSARLALRKTTLEMPETDARYVRLHLQDVAPSTVQGADMTLRYEGLQFQVSGGKTADFRIDQITGRGGPAEPTFDQASFPHPDIRTDKDGNTVILLGRVNLPIARFILQVDNAYYHRHVELWAADTDREDAYRQVASGVIYKIPGMHTSKNTLPVHQPQRQYVRITIVNGDNPPLRIQQVGIAWVRQNLYFIPESQRRYTLYCGGELLRAPTYELQHLLPADDARLQQYTVVSTGDLQQNPDYRPSQVQRDRGLAERVLLIVVIVLLTCGMGFWLYRLLKKLPAQ
jgi:hypothetical protein